MPPTRQELVFLFIQSQSQAHGGLGASLVDIMLHFQPSDEKDRLVLSDEIKGLERAGRIYKDDSRMRNFIDHENIYFTVTKGSPMGVPTEDDKALELLKETFAANRDSLFAFVGAGMSHSAAWFWGSQNIPTASGKNPWSKKFPLWDELIKELANLIPHPDRQQVTEFVDKHDAIDVAEYAKRSEPLNYTKIVSDRLHIDAVELPAQIPPAHQALLELRPKTLVTTNLDQLLEFFYNRLYKSPAGVILDADDLRWSQHAGTTRIIKMHGCIARPTSWVLTRREYVEVWRTKERTLEALQNLLRQSTCLFVGYGLRDAHFNTLYDEILYQQQFDIGKLNFSVVRRPVSDVTRAYWKSRGLNLIGIEHWEKLPSIFDALKASGQQRLS